MQYILYRKEPWRYLKVIHMHLHKKYQKSIIFSLSLGCTREMFLTSFSFAQKALWIK